MIQGNHIDKDTLAIYSLGALDPGEARRVRAHLDACEVCRKELDDYEQVVDGLAHTVPPAQPPARLRARLITAISEEQIEKNETLWHRLRSLPLAPVALAVSAALLVVNVGLWIQVREVRQIEQQLLSQVGEDRIAQGLYAYPDVQRVLIEGEDVYGSAIFEEYLHFAVLYVWGLDPLPESQVYQAWLIEPDGERVSGGLFEVAEGEDFIQVVVQSPEIIKGFDGIGVTVEPAGGSTSPTGQKVLGVDL